MANIMTNPEAIETLGDAMRYLFAQWQALNGNRPIQNAYEDAYQILYSRLSEMVSAK